MESKNNKMSYKEQIRNTYLLSGGCWVLYGLLSILSYRTTIESLTVLFQLFSILFLVAGMILLVSPSRKIKEASDEMAEANLNNAVNESFLFCRAILLGIVVILCICSILKIELNVNIIKIAGPLLYLLLGIQEVVIGHIFSKNEDN